LKGMCGLPPNADIRRKDRHVRFVPLADIAVYSITSSASRQPITTPVVFA
jgi:hypothetical protein